MNSHDLMLQQEKNMLYQQMGVSPGDLQDGKIAYHRGMNYMYVIMMILGKIQDISAELADSYVKAGGDIDAIDEALNKLKNDINNAMNASPNSDAAEQVAKDIQAVKAAYQKYNSDKTAFCQAHHLMIDTKTGKCGNAAWDLLDPNDMNSFLNMFDNEPVDPKDPSKGTVGELLKKILDGDKGALNDFTNLLDTWYKAHQDKDQQNGKTDILNQWLNGGDIATPSSMGANGMITIMDHFDTQISGEVNQYQTEITSIFNAGKGCLDEINELGKALVQGQKAQ